MMEYVWLAILILSVAIEAITMGLTSIWFAFGALIALFATLFGGPLWLQIVLFIVVSVVTMILTRPLAIRYLGPVLKKTNIDAIPGKTGIVVETIVPVEGRGQVKIDGQIWSAKLEDETAQLEKGMTVIVDRIEGVKVVVHAA